MALVNVESKVVMITLKIFSLWHGGSFEYIEIVFNISKNIQKSSSFVEIGCSTIRHWRISHDVDLIIETLFLLIEILFFERGIPLGKWQPNNGKQTNKKQRHYFLLGWWEVKHVWCS